jgi:hypothetical protein
MIRKQRPTFTSAEIELQLSQVNLDPGASSAENLEALAPLIKSIQDNDSEQIYLQSLDKFVEEKEREIEKICDSSYEVRSGTLRMLVGTIVDLHVGLCVVCVNVVDNTARHGSPSEENRRDGRSNGRRRSLSRRKSWCHYLMLCIQVSDLQQKRALLEQKKVARNMDDAIETLQTCLRLLDLVHRVGEMTREGKYWGALRVGITHGLRCVR